MTGTKSEPSAMETSDLAVREQMPTVSLRDMRDVTGAHETRWLMRTSVMNPSISDPRSTQTCSLGPSPTELEVVHYEASASPPRISSPITCSMSNSPKPTYTTQVHAFSS